MKTRRDVLSGLSAMLALLGCPPPVVPPEAVVTRGCNFEGATPGAVTGPFAPEAFRPILRNQPNPGAIVPTTETDFDLSTVTGKAGMAQGQVVVVQGQVLGPDCHPIGGADVQLWQADAGGRYNHRNEGRRVSAADLDPAFGYWGRARTDAEGRFTLKTIVPGAYPADVGWWRPPHLHWSIGASGFGRITTQSFFDGDILDNIRKIRQLNRDDQILNVRNGFEGHMRGAALDTARRRLRDEMVANFTEKSGIPTGALTFRLT